MHVVYSWGVSFPGGLGLNLFQAVLLVSAASRRLVCAQDFYNLTCLRGSLGFYCLFCREGPRESAQLQGLPEAILTHLPSCLRSFSIGQNVLISEEIVTQYPGHMSPHLSHSHSCNHGTLSMSDTFRHAVFSASSRGHFVQELRGGEGDVDNDKDLK